MKMKSAIARIIINGEMMDPTVFAACDWLVCYDGPVED
jgi:hypothetical protein